MKNKKYSFTKDLVEFYNICINFILNLINTTYKKLKQVFNWENYNNFIMFFINKDVYKKEDKTIIDDEKIIEWQKITRNVRFHNSAKHLEKNKRHYKEFKYLDADEQLLSKIYDIYRQLDDLLIKPKDENCSDDNAIYKKLYYEYIHTEKAGFLEFRHHPEEIINAVNDYEDRIVPNIDRHILINALNHESIENSANKIIKEFNSKFNFMGDILFKINYMEFQIFFDFNLNINDKYNISHNLVETRFHDFDIKNFDTEELMEVHKRLKSYKTITDNIKLFFEYKREDTYNKDFYKSKYYKGIITKSGLIKS